MKTLKLLFVLLLFPSLVKADVSSFVAFALDLPNGSFVQGRVAAGTPQNLIGIPSGTSNTRISWLTGNSLDLVSSAGSVSWQINNTNLYGNGSTNFIGALTNDGSDANTTCLGGGGSCASSRGAMFIANGNENGGQTGSAQIEAGNVANATIQFRGGGAQRGTIDGATGAMVMTSTIRSSATASLGWSVVDGTDNTTCESQCTSAAVFGFNLSAGATAPVLVGTTDATADICVCAGAS